MKGVALIVVCACVAACVDPLVTETATDVLTLKSGTMSALRDRRGQGPFRTYEVPPAVLVEAVGEAVHEARGAGGRPLAAVWVKPWRGEVYAKERAPSAAGDDGYAGDWRSAVIAFVHPVEGRPSQSRLEIHAMARGPLHRGVVCWERDLPGWIDEALAERIRPLR